MQEENNDTTNTEEVKQKLKYIRSAHKQAENKLSSIEQIFSQFTDLRSKATDTQDGIEAMLKWAQSQKAEVATTLNEAQSLLNKINTAVQGVENAVTYITSKYDSFKPISLEVFSASTGLKATLAATRKLKKQTDKLADQVSANASTGQLKLAEIVTTTESISKAYDEFLDKKKLLDNEETGIVAQLDRAKKYADDTQSAKKRAESALVSVTNYKDQSKELSEEIEQTRNDVNGFRAESNSLTEDIKNTLNKATQFTLSQALKDRSRSYRNQMTFWAFLQAASVVSLAIAANTIFNALFLSGTDEQNLESLRDGPTLLSVISKFLFTTPLIFAVYYTTSNFRHARNMHDKYAWKETVAKNFQNYIGKLRDEFEDPIYEQERFSFAMRTVDSIYSEPTSQPKRKKYNLGLYNKTISVNIEEEDLADAKKAIEDKIEETHENTLSPEKSSVEAPVSQKVIKPKTKQRSSI